MIRVGSLFAGIGGFDLAAERAGMLAEWQVEIDPDCRRVLACHFRHTARYHDVRDCDRYFPHGDGTGVFQIARPFHPGPVDVITAGFPCQDVSVAGRRAGLAGARSGLFWEIVRLARLGTPRWLVLENVPGLLSSKEGRDFAAVLGALGELGYGWAYRILDAQFFGLAQRRRRVFIVGCLGDSASAAAVLFEPESVCGDRPPRRKTGARAAAGLTAGSHARGVSAPGRRREDAENIVGTLEARGGSRGYDPGASGAAAGQLIVARPLKGGGNDRGDESLDTYIPVVGATDDVAYAIAAGQGGSKFGSGRHNQDTFVPVCVTGDVSHALRAEGSDASEDGTGRGTPIVVGALRASDGGADVCEAQAGHFVPEVADPLCANEQRTYTHEGSGNFRTRNVVAFDRAQVTHPENRSNPKPGDPSPTLHEHGPPTVASPVAVRRLTPTECERLQGFPDGWTSPPLEKPLSDAARYRMLGNAVAVPVVEWILSRLAGVS